MKPGDKIIVNLDNKKFELSTVREQLDGSLIYWYGHQNWIVEFSEAAGIVYLAQTQKIIFRDSEI